MKKIILLFALIVGLPPLAQAQESIKIDPDRSTLTWKGTSLFGFGGHEGTIKLKQGNFVKADGKITGGAFVIDMTTIANTEGQYSTDLVAHLKNEDFFDVQKYPTAKLVMTKIKYLSSMDREVIPLRIDANLTIKGITEPIQYSASIHTRQKQITARLKIDRTRWKVSFRSKSVGAGLKNQIISDAIEFNVTLPLN
ncbi:MAG: YceI family protein [Roseivirga sp.]